MTTLKLYTGAGEASPGDPAPAMPLLSREPLPDTHWPYYSKKLETYWLIDADGWRVPSLVVGLEMVPVYRLTPASFAWFWRAVENLAGKASAGDAARFAIGVLAEMNKWLTTHDLAAEASKARREEVRALPEPWPVYDDRPRKVDMSFNERLRRRQDREHG